MPIREVGQVQVLTPRGTPFARAIKVEHVERPEAPGLDDEHGDLVQLRCGGYYMGRLDVDRLTELIDVLDRARTRLVHARQARGR
jgi:hypothetical protein